ncbi:MAG TPA: hypothetical protein VN420_01425 [Candidatus Fimivivens sp.]|nr:hypothetical protein [Candidatus Fimivivens sp.]
MPNTFSLLSLPALSATRDIVGRFPFPIDFTPGSYRHIAFVFRESRVRVLFKGVDTRDFSFVWLTSSWDQRDLAYALRLYLESTDTPHTSVEKSPSKITDTMHFSLHGLPIPDTVFVDRKNAEQDMALITETCGYPLIIKDVLGSRGKFSEYVSSESELLETVARLPTDRQFLFQRYIRNEYDWGIMVANGEVVSGEKSYPSEGEFRNNTCNGAKERFADVANIPENIRAIAIKASGLLGLAWSRADIIVDRDSGLPYLLEVNRFPGITTGSNEESAAYSFLASHITELQRIHCDPKAPDISEGMAALV